MGVYFYPRIENVSDGWTRDVSGTALARDYDRLQKLIKGYKDLMSFYAPAPEERTSPDDEKWFNPMVGVGILDAMATALEKHKTQFDSYERLKEDIQNFRSILYKAAGFGKRWNLAMET
jgi:hypothetical protein